MHEISIAQSLIDSIETFLKNNKNNRKVKKVHVRMGKLSSVIPQNLSFIFHILTAETDFKGVQLEIEEVPIICECQLCQSKFEIKENGFLCPQCGSFDIEIIAGKELMIDKMEVE